MENDDGWLAVEEDSRADKAGVELAEPPEVAELAPPASEDHREAVVRVFGAEVVEAGRVEVPGEGVAVACDRGFHTTAGISTLAVLETHSGEAREWA